MKIAEIVLALLITERYGVREAIKEAKRKERRRAAAGRLARRGK